MKEKAKKTRCAWVGIGKPHYARYHDEEWGVPVHDDIKHFEMLILEGAQAGLSWETILKRREAYRKVFKNFRPDLVALMSDEELVALLQDSSIIRNRLKIFSARKNAQVFLQIQKEFGSFDAYIWEFVGKATQLNHPPNKTHIPTRTPISDKISKDLKKRGMSFVGTTIIYAYMQAVGLVDDHTVDCFRSSEEHMIASAQYVGLFSYKNWEYAKRLNCTGVVVIAALTDDNKLVLVEQYRIPVSNNVIEMPAGLIGDGLNPKEDFFTAAQRELLEETGYEAQSFEIIISGPSSPGLTNEIQTLVFAHKLKKISAGGGINNENIRLHLVPLISVFSWIKEQEENKKLIDPKILAALYYILQKYPHALNS
jgi:DNA-3-methyladenine glycosylase I